ncbi:MAG TPA: single-stranded DNA-binding protein [Actinoplanes sp.]
MFETNLVIVGNVLTAPEWRRTTKGTLVTHFRVASTARRLDRETGRWVDGDSLRVRVSCWRRLAEGVGASIALGDPVVVVGRLFTRDWTDADGNPRTSYEMEALAVGHDLARGKAKFFRNRPTGVDATAGDGEADGFVRGEAAEPVAEDEIPAHYGDGVPETDEPALADLPTADFDSVPGVESMDLSTGTAAYPPAAAGEDSTEDGGDEPGDRRRSRRTGRRAPVPA